MDKIINSPGPRTILAAPRLRTLLLITLLVVTTCFLVFGGPAHRLKVVPYLHDSLDDPPTETVGEDKPWTSGKGGGKLSAAGDAGRYSKNVWGIELAEVREWRDEDDHEDYEHVESGEERDGKWRDKTQTGFLQFEKDLRRLWRWIYHKTADLQSSDSIYGNTLATLDYKDDRSPTLGKQLREEQNTSVTFTTEKPVRFNPFPAYNTDEWKSAGHAPYAQCKGANGKHVEDLLVFKGRPHDWPEPKLGSYSALEMDGNVCWERETRLGPYGHEEHTKKGSASVSGVSDWDKVNWGDLQRRCVHKNALRYDLNQDRENPYLTAYPETAKYARKAKDSGKDGVKKGLKNAGAQFIASSEPGTRPPQSSEKTTEGAVSSSSGAQKYVPEKRTAILLRAYTGLKYNENDKQAIRAMVTELSLGSGGEYEVFILLHVRDRALRIFDEPETYQAVLEENVPPEFHGMTVLWNDQVVWNIYTELEDERSRTVHSAQWLSVQKFSHDHPQFDFIWNWEMDFRYSGHHYELLDRISRFSRKQPRRGQWERNQQWYIPEYHGDYDSTFRRDIERRYGNETVWGPPSLPFINPVGPKPPVNNSWEDDYTWGVDEDADIVTVSPMFDPVNSNWIITDDIWKFKDDSHSSQDLPRRSTIVTQSRISKRLLNAMHVENMRGNQIASEMAPQTVALLHGLKAVFAPHPIFVDRDWDGDFLNSWFNPSDMGDCSGYGSPMGWGRERRYMGNSWYYRAEPPNRLYNNFMGWVDTGIGGKRWEAKEGRTCLPSVMLHPVKNTEPTKRNHKSGFRLDFG